MIIEPHSTVTFQVKAGETTIIETKQPFKYVIETIGGTTIKGTTAPSTPLEITPSTDIKNINFIFDDDSIKPLHLVK